MVGNGMNHEWQLCNRLKGSDIKLSTRSQVTLQGEPGYAVEIRRGMTAASIEGNEVGKVAAVAILADSQQPVCLILSHLPAVQGYQSIPLSWVERVNEDVVFLNVVGEMFEEIPDWHAE